MVSQRRSRTEREQALGYLKTAYREGRLDQPGRVEGLVTQAGRARTIDGRNTPPNGPRPDAEGGEPAAATRLVLVRARVGDWLYRALKRAVFCWLPPGYG
ncbi:hypothetical protein J7F03_25570 [Streptomyces sp. ISL-43]|uniref:hypothetical protein n=1 Tax=Streptomyces sp. ISL-43 TaxID=2819183 RepID=UPI001BE72ECA|nr:hypothetical protein [Streptomyces sp. ISL-43]MBT2450384.1 hypothetical protein [Streptomyces sp. ISL-43]